MSARRPAILRQQRQRLRERQSKLAVEWMDKYHIHSIREATQILADAERGDESRCAAAGILAGMQHEESLPELLLAARGNNDQVVWCVANSIGSLQSRKPTRELLRLVRLTESSSRRDAAIYTLGLIGDRRATPALIHTLSNKRETDRTRALAADALGALARQRRALRALLQNHDDPSVDVRFTVINALLGHSENPEVRDILRRHLTDDGRLDARRAISELAHSALDTFDSGVAH